MSKFTQLKVIEKEILIFAMIFFGLFQNKQFIKYLISMYQITNLEGNTFFK